MSRSRPSFQHWQKSQSRAWGISSTTWRTQLLSKKPVETLKSGLPRLQGLTGSTKQKRKGSITCPQGRSWHRGGTSQQNGGNWSARNLDKVRKPTVVEYHLIKSVAGWHLLHQISGLSILQYLNKSGIPSHIGQGWDTLIPPALFSIEFAHVLMIHM